MDTKKRKIGFYYVVIGETSVANLVTKDELNKVFEHIKTLNRPSRKYDLHAWKCGVLDSISMNQDTIKLVFESANHSYRAPLMNRANLAKRENPKTMHEGDTIKTHAVLKFVDGDALLVLEKVRGGMAIADVVRYLNYFNNGLSVLNNQQSGYLFSHQVIAKDNIQEELENMDRVIGATVYVDKQILGSESLNFSDRISSVKEDIVISVKSNRLEDIKNTARDLLGKYLMGENTQINKLRIEGRNSRNNSITLDTTFMEKREHVVALMNSETGEVDSASILEEMETIINRP